MTATPPPWGAGLPAPKHAPPPVDPLARSFGRSLWIGWCVFWSLVWLALLLVGFLPSLLLLPLSLAAILIGRPHKVIIIQQGQVR